MDDKQLLNISESKRPTLLYLIIGVQFVVIIILIIVIAVKKCDKCKCPEEKLNPYNPNNFIPVKEYFHERGNEGANVQQGKLNHFDSPYFKMVDVYNMNSNANRTILSKFKTFQQTSELSSQCSALIMALDYYGDKPPNERECFMSVTNITDPDNFEFNEENYHLLNIKNLEKYINSLGYSTTSNDNFTELPYKDAETFSKWVRDTLKKKEPILIYWTDWGGTCSLIIGVDTMGNESPEDHVIIFADTYDTCDHLNDGYSVMGLDKFYYNWQYNKLKYLKGDYEKYATGRFIIIHRKN